MREPAGGFSAGTIHGVLTTFLLLFTVALTSSAVRADDEPSLPDVETWHKMRDYFGRTETLDVPAVWALGLYPGFSLDLGLPDGGALAADIYLSLTDGNRFSAFLGYGETRGLSSDSRTITAGWGGVRPLRVAGRQLGFHGSFVRYHRLDDDDHGEHHGLSIGTEFGAGHLALAFEGGAARSSRNHWVVIARVGLKIALPLYFPLSSPS